MSVSNQPIPELGAVVLRVSEIRHSSVRNHRFTPETDDPEREHALVKELAASMRAIGQLECVGVTVAQDGRHDLVFGHRRLAAAKLIGMTTLRCVVVDDPSAGIAENITHRRLAPVEVVCEVGRLKREYKLTGRRIAECCGIAPSTVSRCLQIAERLHPSIMREWRDAPGAFSAAELAEVSTLSHPAQVEWFVERLGYRPEGAPDGKKASKRGRGRRVTKRILSRQLKAGLYAEIDRLPPRQAALRALEMLGKEIER